MQPCTCLRLPRRLRRGRPTAAGRGWGRWGHGWYCERGPKGPTGAKPSEARALASKQAHARARGLRICAQRGLPVSAPSPASLHSKEERVCAFGQLGWFRSDIIFSLSLSLSLSHSHTHSHFISPENTRTISIFLGYSASPFWLNRLLSTLANPPWPNPTGIVHGMASASPAEAKTWNGAIDVYVFFSQIPFPWSSQS